VKTPLRRDDATAAARPVAKRPLTSPLLMASWPPRRPRRTARFMVELVPASLWLATRSVLNREVFAARLEGNALPGRKCLHTRRRPPDNTAGITARTTRPRPFVAVTSTTILMGFAVVRLPPDHARRRPRRLLIVQETRHPAGCLRIRISQRAETAARSGDIADRLPREVDSPLRSTRRQGQSIQAATPPTIVEKSLLFVAGTLSSSVHFMELARRLRLQQFCYYNHCISQLNSNPAAATRLPVPGPVKNPVRMWIVKLRPPRPTPSPSFRSFIPSSTNSGPDPGYSGGPGRQCMGFVASGCHQCTHRFPLPVRNHYTASGGPLSSWRDSEMTVEVRLPDAAEGYGFPLSARWTRPKNLPAGILHALVNTLTQVLCLSAIPLRRGCPASQRQHTALDRSTPSLLRKSGTPPSLHYSFTGPPPADQRAPYRL